MECGARFLQDNETHNDLWKVLQLTFGARGALINARLSRRREFIPRYVNPGREITMIHISVYYCDLFSETAISFESAISAINGIPRDRRRDEP